MFVAGPVKDFVFPIEVQLGSLRAALSEANNESFASVIFLTVNKEDATVPFKQRVESACNAEGINHKDLHHGFSRHQVYFRAVSQASGTTLDELVEFVKETFRTTGYKKQILYTDLKELYEKLTESNNEQG